MLATSIFSFSNSVFCSMKERNCHICNIYLSSANAFYLFMSKFFFSFFSFHERLKCNAWIWISDTFTGILFWALKPLPNHLKMWPNWKHLQTTNLMLLQWPFFSLIKKKTLGKGENAGYLHFLLFPQYFLKLSYLGSLKVCVVNYHFAQVTLENY